MDSDLPPETWITAAPQDTTTTHDDHGNLVPPVIGSVPFRYHIYWSGSDQDGAVAGFYWAVVETVTVAGEPPPPLPGPKPSDYHFTTKRDSVFIFNVLEDTNNRQHAFYIYAVDNKGKADPTPARVIFNSLDLYPPIPVIEAWCAGPAMVDSMKAYTHATGFIFRPSDAWNGQGTAPAGAPRETTVALCESFSRKTTNQTVVPIQSQVYVRWHSEMRIANNPAVGYKYKIGEGNEVEFVPVGVNVNHAEYNTPSTLQLGPGLKIFTLRAIDQAGAAQTSPEVTRRFAMNMTPDTWFSGPDPIPSQNPTFYSTEYYDPITKRALKYRYKEVGSGSIIPPNWSTSMVGSLLSADSARIMPSQRIPKKTFFEIYTEYPALKHRVYVHSEGDTVHMNSWTLFHAGGFDADSPYALRVTVNNAGLPPIGSTPMLSPGPANGSPIAMRILVEVRPDSTTVPIANLESQIFPLSEVGSFPEPHIGGYLGMRIAGKAYVILRSQDGNGGSDDRIQDPVAFKDSVDAGLIKPPNPRYDLKDKVITFQVDRAPYLNVDYPDFHPSVNPQKPDTIYSRNFKLTFSQAFDDDQWQDSQFSVGGVDAQLSFLVLRFSVVVHGPSAFTGRDTTFDAVHRVTFPPPPPDVPIIIPNYIKGGNLDFDIEVCDCTACESNRKSGRCRRYVDPHPQPGSLIGPNGIRVVMIVPEAQPAPSRATLSSTGPGSSGEPNRSRTP